jgi:hypothetical protein
MTAGNIATAGYHTIGLPAPVSVSAGQKFSVVVKLTTPDYNYPIPLERPWSGYSSRATASAGQSYMSSSGASWTDVATYYSNTNVCLKAFASGTSTPPPPPAAGKLSVTPSTEYVSTGQVGGPFAPASQTVTLKNTGSASIGWTAAKTQSWMTLSRTSGLLAAGATTTLSVSINTAANSLSAGTYSDTVSFTNTTNGSGNTTKTVSLIVNNRYTISVSPSTSLSVSGTVGGPFSSATKVYTVTNTGSASLGWTAARTQPWISLSQTSGTLGPKQSASVTASVNSSANSFQAGSYTGSITFTNATTNSSYSRTVSLTVKTPPITYREFPTTYSWVNPSSHSIIRLSDNAAVYRVALPFAFQFYGKAYTTVDIGSNGLIGFSGSSLTSYNNVSIPCSSMPNAAIYPYWDDLNPSVVGSVRMGTVGVAPNRKVAISWVGVPLRQYGTFVLTFQALLCEGTNDVIFQYQNLATTYGQGASATIGIENATGSGATMHSYNRYGAISNNSAICYSTQNLVSSYWIYKK